MKKIMIVAVTLLCLTGLAVTAQAAGGKNLKEYKIKKMVSQLYDKKYAMDALRNLPSYGKDVVQYVAPLLNDKNNDFVRMAALQIIAAVGDSSMEDKVLTMLKDRDPRVRKTAAYALSRIGTEKSIPQLKVLINDKEAEVRFNAIRALAKLSPKGETDLFIAMLKDYDPRIRLFSVKALSNLKYEKAVPYIAQHTGDPDPAVRYEVVKFYGAVATPECLQQLYLMSSDPDINIQVAAIDEISRFKVEEADRFLADAVESYDKRVAIRALRVLEAKNSPLAVEAARKHVDDESLDMRLISIRIIGKMGVKNDLATMEPLLGAESSRVREMARYAINQINAR